MDFGHLDPVEALEVLLELELIHVGGAPEGEFRDVFTLSNALLLFLGQVVQTDGDVGKSGGQSMQLVVNLRKEEGNSGETVSCASNTDRIGGGEREESENTRADDAERTHPRESGTPSYPEERLL